MIMVCKQTESNGNSNSNCQLLNTMDVIYKQEINLQIEFLYYQITPNVSNLTVLLSFIIWNGGISSPGIFVARSYFARIMSSLVKSIGFTLIHTALMINTIMC